MSKIERQFTQAYDAYADAIFRYCYFRMYNRDVAKEAVQEIYCRVWKYLQNGNEVENIRALLYQTARNYIIDHHRKNVAGREDSLEDHLESEFIADDGADRLSGQIDAKMALKVLDDLDDDQRELILLRYVEGYKPKEIAKIKGESPNVISVRLHRAIKILKEKLI